MSRYVCLPRRCRPPAGRLALLAISLAIPTGTPSAQTSIPFGPGVVLTYVTHNFDQPQNREFQVTIDSLTPDETVFVEDMEYTNADWKSVTVPYRRH
jgi:hypothetical protein